jgi:chemotaxis protein MotB
MTSKPIIVVKKSGGHGGHHGGAWKVAYADFVTAMMSLFIVLWLMNTSQKVRQAVAGYFNDPHGRTNLTGTDQSGTNENLALSENNITDLKKKIEEAIRQMNDLKALQSQIQITITPEGLRIELLETRDGTFFNTGSATLNDNGKELLTVLARQLGDIPNRVSIEGHTDAQPYASAEGYGNWELSTDRANAARRVMQSTGLRKDQVSQVRGYADQKLRVPADPMDPSNRRISLIVQYRTVEAPLGSEGNGNEPGSAGSGGGSSGAGPKPAPSEPATNRSGGLAPAGTAHRNTANAPSQRGGSEPGATHNAVPGPMAKLWAKIHSK